jgi:hypothetical protein
MTGITDILKSKSDGASMQSHAQMKEAGVGPYEEPKVPPPPPPPLREQASQIGDSTRNNSAQLEAALMKRGMTKDQAQSKMKENEKTTAVRYK